MLFGYRCSKCGRDFELFLPSDRRNEPLKQPCPNCGWHGRVNRQYAVHVLLDTLMNGFNPAFGQTIETRAELKKMQQRYNIDEVGKTELKGQDASKRRKPYEI